MAQRYPIKKKDHFEPISQEQLDRALPLYQLLELGRFRSKDTAKRIFIENFPGPKTIKH